MSAQIIHPIRKTKEKQWQLAAQQFDCRKSKDEIVKTSKIA